MPNDLQAYDALRNGVALVETRPGDWLRITGDDRLRFANALVSCDVRALGPGDGAYGFFTDPKGRVLADAAFLAGESDLWVELPEEVGASIAAHMSKYLVADRVEIELLEGWRTVFLAGPTAGEKLSEVRGRSPAPEPWKGSIETELSSGPLVIRADRRLGVPAWAIGGAAGALAPMVAALLEAGVFSAGVSAVRAVRIEQGVPWFGLDFGPELESGGSFPQETGLESWAVSFEKGCYLGQEVIARIHFRGKVNRSLRGLVFEPDSEARAGSMLLSNGEVVGVMGSIADSPLLKRPIGLAIVHHKAEVGSELVTDQGSLGRLVELPFETTG